MTIEEARDVVVIIGKYRGYKLSEIPYKALRSIAINNIPFSCNSMQNKVFTAANIVLDNDHRQVRAMVPKITAR